MSNTIADHHVELVLVVLNTEDHGHGLADLDNTAHLAGVRSLANLQNNIFQLDFYDVIIILT